MTGAALAAWKLKAADFYECVCDGDNCSWSGLNDDVVGGTGKQFFRKLRVNQS